MTMSRMFRVAALAALLAALPARANFDLPASTAPNADAEVAAHISGDEVYGRVMEQIETLLLTVLPRYHAEGRSYVSVAFGCTGGRHRSVHVAEHMAARLREAGFSPTVEHRDLAATPGDVTRRSARARAKDGFKVHQ